MQVKKSKSKNSGFTLIELMVSVTIFSVVMVICMGAILTILNSNRKSQAMRSVMDNLNYTLDDMTRAIRFGYNYHCDATNGDPTVPRDCATAASSFAVKSSDNHQLIFSLAGGRITETIDGSLYYLTSSDTTITKLSFLVSGSYPFSTDQLQPRVIIVISGYAGSKPSVQSNFTLQTTLSQRRFDY